MMAGTRLTSRAIGQWVAGIVATVLGGVLTFIIIDRISSEPGQPTSFSSSQPPASASPTPTWRNPSPTAPLVAAVHKTLSTSFRFGTTMGNRSLATGYSDGKGLVKATGYDNFDIVANDTDMYTRKSGTAGTWLHVKDQRLLDYVIGDPDDYAFMADPLFILHILGQAPKITRSGLGGYVGTVDLSQTDGLSVAAKTTLGSLTLHYGSDASAVTFEATVNSGGYLIDAVLTIVHGTTDHYGISVKDLGTGVHIGTPSAATEPPLRQ
jgi:hypothetical protein